MTELIDLCQLHARISVLEQQILEEKEARVVALQAADKAIIAAVIVADKAVAKVELAAEKTALEASISSLKEAFNQQINFQKELSSQALASQDKAIIKAEAASEKRFESVNEFRATLADQQRDLATKSEVNLRFGEQEKRLNAVELDARENRGRGAGIKEHTTDNRLNIGTAFAGISMLLLAASVVFAAIKLAG